MTSCRRRRRVTGVPTPPARPSHTTGHVRVKSDATLFTADAEEVTGVTPGYLTLSLCQTRQVLTTSCAAGGKIELPTWPRREHSPKYPHHRPGLDWQPTTDTDAPPAHTLGELQFRRTFREEPLSWRPVKLVRALVMQTMTEERGGGSLMG